MSFTEPFRRRFRRPVPAPQRRPYDQDRDAAVWTLCRCDTNWPTFAFCDVCAPIAHEPCVSCKRPTCGRYVVNETEAEPLCGNCYGIDAIPTQDDIANVIAAAERFVGGEA